VSGLPCCYGSALWGDCTCTPIQTQRQKDAAELAMYRREFPVLAERHRNALAELAQLHAEVAR
jgi:hypothetical protein